VTSRTNKFFEDDASNHKSMENTTDTFFSKTGESLGKTMFFNPNVTLEKFERKNSMQSRTNSRNDSEGKKRQINCHCQKRILGVSYRSKSSDFSKRPKTYYIEDKFRGSANLFSTQVLKENFEISKKNEL
jgi:hypothetical protein